MLVSLPPVCEPELPGLDGLPVGAVPLSEPPFPGAVPSLLGVVASSGAVPLLPGLYLLR